MTASPASRAALGGRHILFAAAWGTAALSAGTSFAPAPLFTDHLVLQRAEANEIFGTGAPGRLVRVACDGATAEGTVDPAGCWTVRLPAHAAGGPVDLALESDGSRLVLQDVYFGDVWIASGQSNMAYRIEEGVTDAGDREGIPGSPLIRHFNLPLRPSAAPRADVPGGPWLVSTPENMGKFSAVAHFFARRVQASEGIPIGIIHSSWGGSSIEAWMSPESLAGLRHSPGPEIDLRAAGCASLEELHALNNQHIAISEARAADPREGVAAGVHTRDFDDSSWPVRPLPRWQELGRAPLWMRRTVHWEGAPAGTVDCSLGVPVSRAAIYINGVLVHQATRGLCRFETPAQVWSNGDNIIAMRVADPYQGPFFDQEHGAFELRDTATGRTMACADGWRQSTTVEPPLPPTWNIAQTPSALFYGMMQPLLRVRKTGFIWYQGETNGFSGEDYRVLFPVMIRDWRTRSGQGDLPFLFVQLTSFGTQRDLPEDRGWPWLREAQAATLDLSATGMAVTLDVGDTFDIHPKRKRAVGERLALAALRVRYGRAVDERGPTPTRFEFRDGAAIIHLDHASGLRTSDGGAPAGLSVAGADRVFHRADTRIEEGRLVVRSPQVPEPVAVRYAWSIHPVANICNADGLPAGPFRSDAWAPLPDKPAP